MYIEPNDINSLLFCMSSQNTRGITDGMSSPMFEYLFQLTTGALPYPNKSQSTLPQLSTVIKGNFWPNGFWNHAILPI